MQMPQNSSPGDFAEVDADVKAIGVHNSRERALTALSQLPQIRHLVIRQSAEIRRLFIGYHHQMPARVRVGVEQRETSPAARDDQIGLVIAGLRDARKEAVALRGLGGQDILDAPGRMQRLHP